MNLQEQQQRMIERYRRSADERAEIERRQAETGTAIVDSAEQVRARAERLAAGGAVGLGTIALALPAADAVQAVRLERILGVASELQGVAFLDRGARASRTVARIAVVEGGRPAGFGSGFLVGKRLLLTNNHVLPDAATAAESFADFDVEVDNEGLAKPTVRYALAPDLLFVTNVDLDATLVAVRPRSDGELPGAVHGWNQLVARQGKIVIGEPVNVIGHPAARPKEVALRDNALLNQLDDFLHYKTDTEPGNSGSPVFNDQWEVVALHHSGVPGAGGDGWVANEGARVSVLLRWLDGIALQPAQRAVLAELGPQAQPEKATTGPAGPVAAGRVGSISGARGEAATVAVGTRGGIRGERAGTPQIVFLHGRGTQGRDPAIMRAEWAGGLARGLAAAGRPPLDAKEVWFPHYGDTLAAMTAHGRERVMTEALGAEATTAEAYAPDDPSTRGVYAALIDEAARRAGMPVGKREAAVEGGFLGGLVSLLQGPLSWIADRSGLDEVVIATIFRDVAAYLDRDAVRTAVLDAVLETVPTDGEVVLVAHSLGTVVAMDLIERLPPGVAVPVLVTAGSPLGMDSVYKRLLSGGPSRPARVGTWLNAWAAADAVAVGCPLADTWAEVRDVLTQNRKDRAHDIDEYLSAAEVAAEIGRATATG
jgi:endonuclease G, mitochondrial